jgi:hypothetical protein
VRASLKHGSAIFIPPLKEKRAAEAALCEPNQHGAFMRDRLTICGRIFHLLDHLNDRQANPWIDDP